MAPREPVSTERVESILSSSSEWLHHYHHHLPPLPDWIFSGRLLGLPENEFSAVSDLLLWSNLPMNYEETQPSITYISLTSHSFSTKLLSCWRRYRHRFGRIGSSFINDDERNVICLKVGPATTSEWGSSSASSAFLLTPCLALSYAKSIFSGCCWKLVLILLLFFWLPDYAVFWITSMLVITVTACHLRGRRHLKFAGSKNCVQIPGLPRNFGETFEGAAIDGFYKHISPLAGSQANSMRVAWRKASIHLIHVNTVFSLQDSLVIF